MIVRTQKNKLDLPQIKISFKRSLLLPLTFLILLMAIALLFGFTFGRKGFRPTLSSWSSKIKLTISRSYYRLLANQAEHINIHIAFEDLQQIIQKREEALARNLLITSDEDFVPAEIQYKNEMIPVKLRLKGDWTDHLETNKWSFRIHTKNNKTFKGMRRFSIQDPQTRNNINEWIFLKALKKEGLIALRYDFIDVSINGEHKGIYALEEFFSNELLEDNQRREGPILKFSEDQFWINRSIFGYKPGIDLGSYYQSPIEVFRELRVLNNESLNNQFQEAKLLLRKYRDQEISAEEVFDLDQWTTLFALSDIFRVRHGLKWHNLRFYYNPVTGLLEPVMFDCMAGFELDHLVINADPEELELLKILDEQIFQEQYIVKLEKFSKPEYLEGFFTSIKTDLERVKKIILLDQFDDFNKGVFFQNQGFVRNKLTNSPAIQAFLTQDSTIQILSLQELPVEILSIQTSGGEILFSQTDNKIIIPPASRYQTRDPIIITLNNDFQKELIPNEISTTYRFLGLSTSYEAPLQSIPINTRSIRFLQTSTIPSFVQYDSVNDIYMIPSGSWRLEKDFVLPKDKSLVISRGTDLDFVNRAALISYGPVIMRGTQDQPIKIKSGDYTGQGILVIGASQESLFSHVVFSDLSAIDAKGNNITGSVTLYESPVRIEHSLFENNRSEDMLNIIRSPFSISDSSFINASSDALDIDFSEGEIFSTTFSNIKNDAIDVSGSIVSVKHVKIIKAGDKGISAGESSDINSEYLTITDSYTGIASKDLSEVKINHLSIINSTIGIAAYQKKPEFGPGSIWISEANFDNTVTPFLVEKNSSVFENDKQIKDDQKNVFKRYYETQ